MSKVPCGGFELDESLTLNNGKLGLAPGAGGSQADWNENDSSSPAYILNKPENLGGGVTWFSGSGADTGFVVKRGKNYEDGVSVTGTEIINAFENGVCRFNVTIVSCCGSYNTNGTMNCYYLNNDSIKCYVTGHYGDGGASTKNLVSESIAL